MNTKPILAAIALAIAISSPTHAATFDFSFDASTATGGDTTLMASGTLDIDAAPGGAFTSDDISNINIIVSSDLFSSATLFGSYGYTSGTIAASGLTAEFTDVGLFGAAFAGLYCKIEDCQRGVVRAAGELTLFIDDQEAYFGDPGAALAAFKATAQVSAVPLPAGGLLLLSGLAGVAGLKRRKKRAA